jgi:hypothetical protein
METCRAGASTARARANSPSPSGEGDMETMSPPPRPRTVPRLSLPFGGGDMETGESRWLPPVAWRSPSPSGEGDMETPKGPSSTYVPTDRDVLERRGISHLPPLSRGGGSWKCRGARAAVSCSRTSHPSGDGVMEMWSRGGAPTLPVSSSGTGSWKRARGRSSEYPLVKPPPGVMEKGRPSSWRHGGSPFWGSWKRSDLAN